jgi:ergothioneine biosynthesis protein EgtB
MLHAISAEASPSQPTKDTAHSSVDLPTRLQTTRVLTLALCASLEAEDMTPQSMPDTSPAKWHLAHTTWFFETFALLPHLPGYCTFHPGFAALFNSYYVSAGPRFSRPQRGLVTRPTVAEVRRYRAHVDVHLRKLLDMAPSDAAKRTELARVLELGLNHEQQHQELLLTDMLHLLSHNPLKPAWRILPAASRQPQQDLRFLPGPEGAVQVGHADTGFCFDNEAPRHTVWLAPHAIGSRLVSNAEYADFMRDGGYDDPMLWLSDGWAAVQREGWRAPLYWSGDGASSFTLGGELALDPAAPVCHISHFEADAFARWAGARLPTEAEWETFAAAQPQQGNLLEAGQFRPTAAAPGQTQIFGDVWEWTGSAYLPYPGYQAPAGALGEYNGKFMSGQMVLRGGSCISPPGHVRSTYRNFFYPHQRWQFMGLRLAKDAP